MSEPMLLDMWAFRQDTKEASKEDILEDPNPLNGIYMVGHVYGHPQMEDGQYISTAFITSIHEHKVNTDDGLTYHLMNPDPDYLSFVEKTEGAKDSSIMKSVLDWKAN